MDNEPEGPTAVRNALSGGSATPHLDNDTTTSDSQALASPSSAPENRYIAQNDQVFRRAANALAFSQNQSASQGGPQASSGLLTHNSGPPSQEDVWKWMRVAPDFGLGAGGDGDDDGRRPRRPMLPAPVMPPITRMNPNYASVQANQSATTQSRAPPAAPRGWDSTVHNARVIELQSVPSDEKHKYMTAFSKRLARDISNISSSPGSFDSYREQLSGWLETFSSKLQRRAITEPTQDAAALIDLYQGNIIEQVRAILSENNPDNNILGQASDFDDPNTTPSSGGHGDRVDLPNLAIYTQSIPESTPYRWLLSKVECHTTLETKGDNEMAAIGAAIRSKILEQPALDALNYPASVASIGVRFTLEWNPTAFLQDQGYDTTVEAPFDSIICLTGTWQHAQAMTIAEYMEQTWPHSNGATRDLLNKQLSKGGRYRVASKNSPEFALTFRQRSDTSCEVTAAGVIGYVSEVGEQLAWLAATLRTSVSKNGVLGYRPTMFDFDITHEHVGDYALVAACRIGFEVSQAEDITSQTAGFCWAGLFQNPILVTNYPIRRRTEVDTGLEMSLDMMSQFVESRRLTKAGGRLILKGFSFLLVATAVKDDTVMWHLFYNPKGDRISYCDPRVQSTESAIPEGFLLGDLQARRHVVGWCSNVCEDIGLSGATYDIRASNLPPPASSIAIETFYIEAGGPVVAGVKASLGKKDKPARLKRGSTLLALLDSVCDKPVVFHDVDDKRAWLVEGPSAALHIVRASIERDRGSDVYGPLCMFDGTLEGGSPMEILRNLANLNTALYPNLDGGEAPYTFRDRVREVLENLEVLVDHQVQATKEDGYWFRKSVSGNLKHTVGWDFWDVAKPRLNIGNRFHGLGILGHGWADYIRHTGALVIFGSGFGELIRAESPDGLCPDWRTVRTGDDLLCASIKTLKKVQVAKGETTLCAGDLTADITWSSRCELFEPCRCLALQPLGGPSHVDPVQVLLPKFRHAKLDVGGIRDQITLRDLEDNGAVVFGHTPYHKSLPKPKLPDYWRRSSSDGEQGHSRAGSSAGSSAGLTTVPTTVDGGSVRDPQSPASLEPTSATKQFVGGLPIETIEIQDVTVGKRRKKPSWIRSLFCGVSFPSRKGKGKAEVIESLPCDGAGGTANLRV